MENECLVLRAGRDATHPSVPLPARVCSKTCSASGTEHTNLAQKPVNKHK